MIKNKKIKGLTSKPRPFKPKFHYLEKAEAPEMRPLLDPNILDFDEALNILSGNDKKIHRKRREKRKKCKKCKRGKYNFNNENRSK